MFKLIRQLLEFQAAIGISLRELMRFVQDLMALGRPPIIADEEALRQWLRDLVAVLKAIAAETPTAIDDDGVEMLSSLLDNDAVWKVVYSTIVLLVSDGILFGEAEEAELSDKLATAMADQPDAKVATIEPLVIIAVIRIIIALIQAWRK